MKAEKITGTGVWASQNSSSFFFEGDTVVLAVGLKSNDQLFRNLQGRIARLYAIGDCIEPHRIAEAVEAAFRVAQDI